jgi:hypothetical protein
MDGQTEGSVTISLRSKDWKDKNILTSLEAIKAKYMVHYTIEQIDH